MASAAIALGSIQQIGERTTGTPLARATLASCSPSRDIPNRWSRLARSSRSVQGQNGRTATPRAFQVAPGLDELVLAAARRLEGGRRGVVDDLPAGHLAPGPLGQPSTGGDFRDPVSPPGEG